MIRDAEPGWPAPGSKFHHTIGVGPLKLSDHTESLEADAAAPAQAARQGPPARHRDGDAGARAARRRHARADHREPRRRVLAVMALNPVVHVATKLRNAESLMRLEELALRR